MAGKRVYGGFGRGKLRIPWDLIEEEDYPDSDATVTQEVVNSDSGAPPPSPSPSSISSRSSLLTDEERMEIVDRARDMWRQSLDRGLVKGYLNYGPPVDDSIFAYNDWDWTTAKDSEVSEDGRPSKAKKKVMTKRKKVPHSPKSTSGESTDMDSWTSYGSSNVRTTDPFKLMAATETLRNNIDRWFINKIVLRLKFQEKDFGDATYAFFSVDGDTNNCVRCRIDAAKSLKGTDWWELNKSLLDGEEDILRRTFNEYIETFVNEEEIIVSHDDRDAHLTDGLDITVNVVKTDAEVARFEKILIEKSTPVLEAGQMKKVCLITLDRNADVTLGLEGTLFFRVMDYLNDPRPKGIIDPPDVEHRKMYKLFHEKFNEKQFLAPLGDNWDQLYRVEILYRLGESDEFRVRYIDLEREERITVDKFACMTRKTNLPPLLRKLPPQVTKVHLYELTNVDYPLSRYLNVEGRSLMAKLVQEQTKEFDEINEVILFRYAKANENSQDIISLNEYLKSIEDVDFSLTPIKITSKIQETLHSYWKEFQNETESLSFVDKIYEQYFLANRGVMQDDDDEEDEECDDKGQSHEDQKN